MRYAIIADIHSNLEALQTVMEECRNQGVRQFFCAGDIIGYGANPKECLKVIKDNRVTSVAGNHEWAVCGRMDPRELKREACEAVMWTRNQFSAEDFDYLNAFPLTYAQDDFVMVHGTLNKPEQFHYLRDMNEALDTFYLMERPVCFVGHTHVAKVLIKDQESVSYAKEPVIYLEENKKYIVNVGSVGQPRDGNPMASYCIYDPDLQRVELKRVAYDVTQTQGKIFQSGLPFALAQRLIIGQ